MARYDFTFDADDILGFRFCPYCGSEGVFVYIGDYGGSVTCLDCDDGDERLDFVILQEVMARFPNDWKRKFYGYGEWEHVKGSVVDQCVNCGKDTTNVSILFESAMCSEECENEQYADMQRSVDRAISELYRKLDDEDF